MGPNSNVQVHRKEEEVYENSGPHDRHPSPSSPSSGYLSYHCEDLVDHSSLEENIFHQLSDKIESLQHQITLLEENQSNNDEKYRKVKQNNSSLLNRVHALEDHIRDLEVQGENWRKEEEKMLITAMARQERDKMDECDQLKSEIFNLRKDLLSAREEVIKSQSLVERLRNEKLELKDQLHSKEDEVEDLKQEVIKLHDMNKRIHDEEKANMKMIEVLSLELEELRRSQQQQANDVKRKSSSCGSESRDMKYLIEFKEELKKLREENRSLREANEELEAQILVNHLEEGRSLLREEEAASSLAEEMNNLSVEPLRNALKEQKECNKKLRAYIDGILLNIVENYPQLLEVKKK
ncbi:rab11 family-interacting protein nuf [Brevipalpus obovatus]|uniref:rab11 family-interacting protein nuf n=1 Tax=Brevipalpus obovatus TaxID=246614 RepID=UPI003D9F74BF